MLYLYKDVNFVPLLLHIFSGVAYNFFDAPYVGSGPAPTPPNLPAAAVSFAAALQLTNNVLCFDVRCPLR